MPNTTPIFVGTPRITSAEVLAPCNRDGSGTIYQLFVPNTTNGSRIERINCWLAGTVSGASTALAARIFICDAAGANPRIFREASIASVTPTPSTGIVGGNTTFTFAGGLVIGTSSTIYVGQSSGDTTVNRGHWTAEGGDF